MNTKIVAGLFPVLLLAASPVVAGDNERNDIDEVVTFAKTSSVNVTGVEAESVAATIKMVVLPPVSNVAAPAAPVSPTKPVVLAASNPKKQ